MSPVHAEGTVANACPITARVVNLLPVFFLLKQNVVMIVPMMHCFEIARKILSNYSLLARMVVRFVPLGLTNIEYCYINNSGHFLL
jgi:hypothetical protein